MCGKVSLRTHLLVSGKTARLTVMGCTSGKTETDTRASGTIVLSMARVLTHLQMVIHLQELISRASLMGMVSTNGRMEVYIWENSKTG